MTAERVQRLIDRYWDVRYRSNPEAGQIAAVAVIEAEKTTSTVHLLWARFLALSYETATNPHETHLDVYRTFATRFRQVGEIDGSLLVQVQLATTLACIGRADEGWDILAREVCPRLAELKPVHRFMALVCLANVALSRKDDVGALRYNYQCLELARHLDDPARIALSLDNLADAHARYGNLQETLSCCQEALTIAEMHGLTNRLRGTPATLAMASVALGDRAQAEMAMGKWMTRFASDELDYIAFRAHCMMLYLAARRPENWGAAETHLRRIEDAVAVRRATANLDSYGPYWVEYARAKGSFLRLQGRLDEAVAALTSADDVYHLCEVSYIQTDARHELYLCHAARGDWQHALRVHVEYADRLAEHLNGANAMRLQAMAIQHAVETERIGRQKAEEATRLKSEFLANMSHEIRTPMNAVIGLTHLALQTGMTPKQRDYLGKIHRSGQSLLALINDILDFSKIEAGKLDIEAVPFRVDDMLANVAAVTSQKAADKQIEYLYQIAPDVPPQLVGDALRLGQVLINLVNNAVKFTEPGGEIELAIQVIDRQDEHVGLRFHVRDTGIGMSPEQQARLFQPFTQADGSTTRKYGGTGLGLSISQRLVELMGGRIALASAPGVGSTFSFELHLPAVTAAAHRNTVPSAICGARVLVVDDSAAARMVLAVALAVFPLRVDVVDSAEAALAAIAAQDRVDPYRLVLTDWRMPGTDGLALIDAVRRNGRLARQPKMVLVTAFGNDVPRQVANLAGPDGVLFKPVNPSSLTDLLQELAATEPRAGEASAQPVAQSAPDFSGMRVLLAEDNAINQQVATELLNLAGIAVNVAENGEQAVALALSARPDTYALIFMDLQMPVMDGHAATIAIRQDERLRCLPIIALTAHATSDIRERCMREGMQDYLTKPIQPEALHKLLERWMPHEPVPQGNVPPPVSTVRSESTYASFTQIDAAVGLRHMAGNDRLYRKLLARFLEAHRDTASTLKHYLERGETEAAMRHAHTLGGLAGTMGAARVQVAARVLEAALLGPHRLADDELLAMIGELDRVMQPLIAELAAMVDATTDDGRDAGPVDPEQVAAALAELGNLLDACSSKAIPCFELHELQFRHYFNAHAVERLGSHIRACEFDSAREVLGGMAMS